MSGTAERSGYMTDGVTTMQHQHDGEPPDVVFVLCFMDSFLHQTSSGSGIGAMSALLNPAGDLRYSAIDQIA